MDMFQKLFSFQEYTDCLDFEMLQISYKAFLIIFCNWTKQWMVAQPFMLMIFLILEMKS